MLPTQPGALPIRLGGCFGRKPALSRPFLSPNDWRIQLIFTNVERIRRFFLRDQVSQALRRTKHDGMTLSVLTFAFKRRR